MSPHARAVAVIAAALLAATPRAGLSQRAPLRVELRPFAGAYIPAGAQHDLLRHAGVVGGQVAVEFDGGYHAVASFSWAATEKHRTAPFGVTSARRVEMAQFDLGAEWMRDARRGPGRVVRPFRGEGRQYVVAFRGLGGTEATTLRPDASVALGVAYHLW